MKVNWALVGLLLISFFTEGLFSWEYSGELFDFSQLSALDVVELTIVKDSVGNNGVDAVKMKGVWFVHSLLL